MSREKDRINDMEWWDKHRAGALGGFKEGYVFTEDPYAHMTQEEKQAMISRARERDQEDKQAEINKAKSYAAADKRLDEYYAERVKQHKETYEKLEERAQIQEAADLRAQKAEEIRQAVLRAKKRYNSLSPFMKIFHKIPEKVNFNIMNVDQIDQLYHGKRR